MRRLLFAPALMFVTSQALAQAPSPAQMGITPSTTPEVLQTLDNTQTWVPIGTVNSTTHTFTPVGGGGGGGGATPITSNSVLGNSTGSAALPTPLLLPSCSSLSSALTYTLGSGFGCNIISGGGSAPAGATGSIQTNGGGGVFGSVPNPLPIVNGGTGASAPTGVTAGANVTVVGSFPNQTVSASGGGGGGTVSSFTTHAGLLSATTAFSTQTLYQSGFTAAGDGGAATYEWNATSYCALNFVPPQFGTSGNPTPADGIVCILPSSQAASTAGRYILQIGNSIDVRQFGMRANGQDNAPFVAGLMAAMGAPNSFSGGYDVVFPPVPGQTYTSYYFSKSFVLSRSGHYYCGGGVTNNNSVALVFAAGVHGVIQEDANYTADGGQGGGAVEGCGIYSQGHASPNVTPGSTSITGATLFTADESFLAPAAAWHIGDGIFIMPKQMSFQPINGNVPAVPPGTSVTNVVGGTTLTISNPVNAQFSAAHGQFIETAQNNFVAGDVVVLGATTYTFVSSIGATPGNVLRGPTFLDSATNLANCVNKNTTSITCVATSAPNVTADIPLSNIINFYALVGGTAGNSIAVSYTPAGVSAGGFSGSPMAGATATGTSFLLNLPLAQSFTINTTSGSNTALITASASGRFITPGEVIWNKDFPAWTTVLTVQGSNVFTQTASNNFLAGDMYTTVYANPSSTPTPYTFVAAPLGSTPGTVLLGSSFNNSANNLNDAINRNVYKSTALGGAVTSGVTTSVAVTLCPTIFSTGEVVFDLTASTQLGIAASCSAGTLTFTGTATGNGATSDAINFRNYITPSQAQTNFSSFTSSTITMLGSAAGPFNGTNGTSSYTPSGTAAGTFDHAQWTDQTITLAQPFLNTTPPANATNTTTGGTLWTLPAGLKRDVTAFSRHLNFSNWFAGLEMPCESNFLGNLNCTFSGDYDNLYEEDVVGTWASGNNYSGSVSMNESGAKNYLADGAELGALGRSYFNFNSHSPESGTSAANVLMNCTNQNGSFWQGGYFGVYAKLDGPSYPLCADPVKLLPATVGGGLITSLAAGGPAGSSIISDGILIGSWKTFSGWNNQTCIQFGGPYNGNYAFGFGLAQCSVTTGIWILGPNTTLGGNTWDLSLGVGAPIPVERFVNGSTGNNGGGIAIEFPAGILLDSYEDVGGASANSRTLCMSAASPTGAWHLKGDFCFNTNTTTSTGPIGWVDTANGSNFVPVGAVSTFSSTKTAGSCVFTILNGMITNVTGC